MQLAKQLTKRCIVPGLLTAALAGCQPPPKPVVAPPADEDAVRLTRQYYTAADPKAIVGLVTAVLPGDMYAAVGDVTAKDFNEGDALSFIDSNKKFLTHGVVRKIAGDTLQVKYEKPALDSRAPMVGDLAVRFKP